MILNSYIAEQLAIAHQSDLLEFAQRDRPTLQAHAHNRSRLPSRGIPREGRRSRPADPSLCAAAPRTAA
jgi:hypothetical protein